MILYLKRFHRKKEKRRKKEQYQQMKKYVFLYLAKLYLFFNHRSSLELLFCLYIFMRRGPID